MKTRQIITGFLVLIIAFIGTSNAQVFHNMAGGVGSVNNLASYGAKLYENNGNVYASYQQYGPTTTTIKKWDGTSWSTLPAPPSQQVQAIKEYNNELYIGTYDWLAGGNFYKLSGSSWVPVFSNFTGVVWDLEVYNGLLLCGGAFTIGTTSQKNVTAYNGNSMVSMPAMRTNDTVRDIHVINNEIWVAGSFRNVNGVNDSVSVKKLKNGTSWEWQASAYKNGFSNYPHTFGVFDYKGKVYVTGKGLYEIANDTAYSVGTTSYIRSFTEFDGFVYLTDGSVHVFDGNNVFQNNSFPGNVQSFATSSSNLYAFFGDDSKINGVDFGHILRMGHLSLGLLKGKVYVDNNSNCTFDQGVDITAPAMTVPVQVFNTFYMGSTDGQGNYSIYLPAGTYPTQPPVGTLPIHKYYQAACSTPNSVSISASQTTNQDFVFAHDGSTDIESTVFMYGGQRVRQGFTERGVATLRNPGIAINGPVSLKLTIPGTVTFVSSIPAPTSTNGNTLTYTFPSIGQAEEKAVFLWVEIDTNFNSIGDTLCWYSEATPVSGDVDLGNDNDSMCTAVLAAYDPNDKTPNVGESLPGLSRLDYHIRFQNTGTDTAYTVKIVDTLESYFDPASIMINGASHDYSFAIAENNVIAWTFENILLPDCGANYAESQGFVNFSIDVDPTLNVGDIIDNDAEIYFDFQPAVHTNHAQTVIVSVLGVEEFLERQTSLEVYPNPAQGMFCIENSLNEKQEVKLIDATGKVIKNISLQPEMKAEIRTESLAPGIYFINNGSNTHRVIITP